jgi:hypothetical protein
MRVLAMFSEDFGEPPSGPHPYITTGREYLVVGISDRSYRLLDDSGEPYLYPREWFEVIEPHIPEDWVRTDYPEGEYCIDPPEVYHPGFYEDYFDDDPEARRLFQLIRERLLRGT